MKNKSESKTGTSEDVLDYYSRNWDKIANCYAVDEDGFPFDPAWYRKKLYIEFLKRKQPSSVLDVGCGGGWSVLDALELGIDARGFEPVLELKEYGCKLLEKSGQDANRITQDDLASLARLPDNSEDCIALLSVLPHVPKENWDQIHADISRVLKPGGILYSAYRNELFDLYTFNSFTLAFYDRTLWVSEPYKSAPDTLIEELSGLITHPHIPGPYFTAAKDESFGKLDRVKSNPLTMNSYLSRFNLDLEKIQYYHFHCVPPLLKDKVPNYKKINHDLELTCSDDWRGNFMAAIFMIEATKIG